MTQRLSNLNDEIRQEIFSNIKSENITADYTRNQKYISGQLWARFF